MSFLEALSINSIRRKKTLSKLELTFLSVHFSVGSIIAVSLRSFLPLFVNFELLSLSIYVDSSFSSLFSSNSGRLLI
jgi:NADH:ubiquinone oxidoreductase subunit 2 (subunit N)